MTITNDLANWAATGANTSVLIANGANIGIGNSTPTHKLSVAGDIISSANLYGTIATTSQLYITANNANNLGGKTEGNLNVNNALTANSSSYLGSTAASGYQTTAGLSANVATLTANSATYANSSSTNTFTIGTAAYFIANGNVGIGTSSPGYLLHVRKDNTAVTTWITSDNRTATGSFGSGFLSIAANGTNYSYMTQGADGNQYIINALSTGSIIMQTGGAVSLLVGSNGNVGIGTTTPGAKLDIQSSSAGTATGLLKLYGTNASDRYSGIDFHGVTSESYNKIAQITAQVTNGGTGSGAAIGGDLIFRTNGSATNVPTERMRIDNSGRVTIPYQPRFAGYPTTDYSTGSMPTGVILFTASYNVGSNYNATTGRFTAPVAGYYKTTWGGLQLINTVTSLQVNGADINNGNHYAGSTGPNYINMTQTNIVYLSAGDYLTIRGWNGGGYYASWYLWTVELVG
jgi:hypothetical protein